MKKIKSNASVLTQSDIPKIITSMKRVFLTREELNNKLRQFPTRVEMHKLIKIEVESVEERLNEKISHLPTKEEFFNRMDQLSGEIEKVRLNQTLHDGEHQKITVRFEKIDRHLGISTSS